MNIGEFAIIFGIGTLCVCVIVIFATIFHDAISGNWERLKWR